MEKQITEIPVLQKNREPKAKPVEASAGCCSTPADQGPCCTPSKNAQENNGACCAQPADGSACCDK